MHRAIFLSFLFWITQAVNAQETAETVHVFNQVFEEELGIDLKSFSYLITTGIDNFLPVDYYKETGEYVYFEKLVAEGFVELKLVNGLPDGSELGEFMQLIPTQKGIEALSVFVAQ